MKMLGKVRIAETVVRCLIRCLFNIAEKKILILNSKQRIP